MMLTKTRTKMIKTRVLTSLLKMSMRMVRRRNRRKTMTILNIKMLLNKIMRLIQIICR